MGGLCSSPEDDARNEKGFSDVSGVVDTPEVEKSEAKKHVETKQSGDGFELHKDPIFDIGIMSGKKTQVLTCSDDKTIKCYDWKEQKVVQTWKGHKRGINRLAVVPDTDLLFSCSRDKTVKQWSLSNGSECVQTFTGHTLNVQALTATTTQVVSGGRDYMVKVWDIETGKEASSTKINRNVVMDLSMVPGNDHECWQVSEDLSIRIWDLRSMEVIQTFRGDTYFPLSCDVHPTNVNYLLASYNGFSNEGCAVRVWDKRMNNEAVNTFKGHTEAVLSCTWINEHIVASGSKDQTIRLWDTADPTVSDSIFVTDMGTGSMSVTALAAANSKLYAGCIGAFLTVFNVEEDATSLNMATRTKGVDMSM